MLPILADFVPPKDETVAQTVYMATAVAVAGYYVLALWHKISPPLRKGEVGPQPFVVQEHHEYATRADLEKLEEDLRDLVEKISKERSTSVANLHNKIEESVKALNGRIDFVPDRVIQILKNTGIL